MFEAVLAAVLIASGSLAPAAQKLEPFVGTWVAEFDGTVWVRLELSAAGDALGGRIALGNMQVDADGRVKAAEKVPERLDPISDVVVRDSTLTFAHKDGNDTDLFELHLLAGDAELRFMLDAATLSELKEGGITAPKPVRLKRVVR